MFRFFFPQFFFFSIFFRFLFLFFDFFLCWCNSGNGYRRVAAVVGELNWPCGLRGWPRLQCTHAVHACSARLQCTRAVHACSARMQCTPAVHVCSARMQCTCAVHARARIRMQPETLYMKAHLKTLVMSTETSTAQEKLSTIQP